jgi:hypothetical protein
MLLACANHAILVPVRKYLEIDDWQAVDERVAALGDDGYIVSLIYVNPYNKGVLHFPYTFPSLIIDCKKPSEAMVKIASLVDDDAYKEEINRIRRAYERHGKKYPA